MHQANAMHTEITPRGRRRRWLMTSVPLLATAMWLRPALADPRVRQSSRTLMGTRVDMTIDSADARDADLAMKAAWDEMTRLADMMSRYRIGNPVHAMHVSAGLQPVPVPTAMMQVLRTAQRVSAVSHGAFDVTVGALAGWRFDADAVVPQPAEIARELPLVNYRDLVLDTGLGTAFLRRRGMRIDLGGIAKLPILQAGMSTLKAHGVQSAMINGGGDVLVSGKLLGKDWRVGVRDPLAPERLIGVLALSDAVVASSGDYERCFTVAGRRYHHILDPDTGMPEQGTHGVALVARHIDDINGFGPAIMVAGEARGRQLLARSPDVHALIVGADRRRWLSDGMAARLSA